MLATAQAGWAADATYVPLGKKTISAYEVVYASSITEAGDPATSWVVVPNYSKSTNTYTQFGSSANNGNPQNITDAIESKSSAAMIQIKADGNTLSGQKRVVHMHVTGTTGVIAHGYTSSAGRGLSISCTEYVSGSTPTMDTESNHYSFTRKGNGGSLICQVTGLDSSKEYIVSIYASGGDANFYCAEFLAPTSSGPTAPSFDKAADTQLVKNSGKVTLTSASNTIYYKWSTSSSAYAAADGATLADEDEADGYGASSLNVTAPNATGTYYLYAVAKDGSNNYSNVVKRSYTIIEPTAAAPTFQPGASTISATQKITLISTTENANIYYTTNGDTPTSSSTKYNGPFILGNSATVKAIAYDSNNANPSAVSSKTYTVDAEAPTLSSTTPTGNNVAIADGNATITFSENVTIKDASKFTIDNGATLNIASVNNNVVTIPYTGLANGKTYTITIEAGAVKDAAGNENEVDSYTFTTVAAAVSAGDKWNFTTMSDADKAAYQADKNWNTSSSSKYYTSTFSTSTSGVPTSVISTTIQQIKDLKFIRTSGGGLTAGKVQINLPDDNNDADGYLNFGCTNGAIILPTMTAGTKVTVDFDGTGSSYGILPTNATTEGGVEITSLIKSASRTTTTFKVKTDGEVTISVNNNNVRIYKITVGEAVDVAEPSFDKADGSGYDGALSVGVTTKQTGGTTYWAFATTALDRDAIVAASHTEGTATITAADANEQTIVLSAVTKYETGGNTYYSEVVTASYPYTGTKTLGFNVANINVPAGGQQTFAPTFIYKDGTEFDPEEDTANPDLQNIYDYFNFTFTQTGNTNVPTENLRLVEGGVVIAKAEGTNGAYATVGKELTVTIKADKKTGISSWPFDKESYTVTGVTATVVERGESGTHMDFWWDPTFTTHVNRYTDWNYGTGDDAKVSIFSTAYPNGRMIYLAVEDGWTAYVAAGLADKSAKILKPNSNGVVNNEWNKTDKVNYLKYRRNDPTDVYPDVDVPFNGLPLVVNDEDWGSDTQKTFYVNIKTVDANGKEGSPVKARYTILKNDDYRPAAPSLTPAESNAQRNTAQTVLTQGAEGAYIYGKFGGGYTVPNLVNSEGINGGRTSVGVFSTEVKDRKITAVQVGNRLGTSKDDYFYVSKEKNNTYNYLFASEISLKSNTYTTNVREGEDPVTVEVKPLIDKITYYNKDSKKYINIADSIQARSGETAQGLKTTEKDRVTYSIEPFNGADDTTIDEASGVVTIGQKSGYVVVTATYHGGYSKTVSDRKSTTDESKATYTIYLVNPDEQIPTITPGSRNFVDEQSFMIQAPDRWNALYMVVAEEDAEKDANYNAATATYSSDNPKVKMLEKGEYIRLTVTKTSKVRAFAYDPNVTEHNKPGQENTTSKEVTATYTYLEPLKAPTLSPYGTSEEPHIRTAKSLTVIATTNDPYAGLEVYYTLDGSDPTPTTGEKYNGSEKINISGASTTIKAITYRPETGQISPVTTGVYMYTGSIKQPKFKVKGNYYTSGTITVSSTDEITIESEDGGAIYYTLDGATPTTDDAVPYTTGFTIVKNTTGKAIAVKDDASSPITTVEFELATEKNDLWEAVEETTPGGKLDANDRYVAVGNTGHSSTKAVKYLTATFGGMDAAGWNKASIGEKTQGTPLDGVGKYSISTTRDVWDETDAEVKNTANTVHGKTFALPAKGNFVRFEPERDGDLTIWLLQQGGLHYTDDGGFCNQFIRLRPVYMFDEKGTSIEASNVQSSARLSDNWDNLDVSDTPIEEGRYGNWVAKNKSQNGVVNKYYDEDQSEAIYNMYKSHLTTGGNDISSGDPIAPFVVPDGDVKNMLSTLGLTGYGYVMPSGGNVKYTFHVEGGKSYYFFGYRTKLAIRGFQFTPSNGQDVEPLNNDVTLDDTSDATSGFNNNICNVTFNRKFYANTWAAVTFPFSVSVAQMKKVFGDKVDLIHFDNVSGSKINFKRHWYPMIVAGTPVFIKPSQDTDESVKFEGVHIETETVNAVSGDGGYKMTGSFTPATIKEGDYYISGGKLAVRKGSSIETKAYRSWLTADSNTGARFDLTTGTADAFAEEAWSVIGNPQPFVASDETVVTYINGVQEDGIINNIFEGPTGIYTINGQLIRKDATSLEGLSKGIYIVNGKKIAVK